MICCNRGVDNGLFTLELYLIGCNRGVDNGLFTGIFQHDKEGVEYYSKLISPLLYNSDDGKHTHSHCESVNETHSNDLILDYNF